MTGDNMPRTHRRGCCDTVGAFRPVTTRGRGVRPEGLRRPTRWCASLAILSFLAAPVAMADVPGAGADQPGDREGWSAPGEAVAPPADVNDGAGMDGVEQLVVRVRSGVRLSSERGRPGFRVTSPDVAGDRRDARERQRDEDRSRALAASLEALGVRSIVRAMRGEPADAALARSLRLDRYYLVRLREGADAEAVMARLRAEGELVEHVERDGVGGVAELVPNDPFFSFQYGLQNTGQAVQGAFGVPGADVDATNAWPMTTGADLVIAVLDSGVNQHVDLGGKVLPGWNVPNEDSVTTDACNSHGTHVSGIAAAIGDNGVGVAGMSWGALILPIVVVDPCNGFESWLADGIMIAVDAGVDVINMSLQYSAGTEYLHDAVKYAAAKGVVMVAASGNSGASVSYPAKWPETIAVGATNNSDQRWSSSNFGPELDLMAPGVNVYSLSGTVSYGFKTGTSMATPFVSGLAALMLSIDPALTPEAIREVLHATAADLGDPGFDELTGHGRLEAAAALESVFNASRVGDLNGDGVVDGTDLGMVLSAWGACAECTPEGCAADLDGDCVVDGRDIGLLLANWG